MAERFLAARPESRVLYMSGYTEDAIFIRNEKLQGDVHFIKKPFNPTDLAKSVRIALNGPCKPKAA